MTTVIPAEDYYIKKREVDERITNLANEIEADQAKAAELETEYKQLVFAQDDDKADEVFQEKQSLASRIKSKKSRLQTIKDMKDEDLQKFAVEVMNSAVEGLPAIYQERVDEQSEKVKAAKTAYLNALDDLHAINLEYHYAHDPYKEIFNEVGFDDYRMHGESKKRGMTNEMMNKLSRGKQPRLVPLQDFFVKSYANGRFVLVEK